jgi:hypothetical protein
MNKKRFSGLGIFVLALFLIVSFVSSPSYSQDKNKSVKNNYLVMLPHTKEECLKTLDEYSSESPKLLSQVDWGCMAGDHTGYIFMMGDNESAVRNMLPANQRKGAKIEMVNKFTKEQIKSFHEKH